MSTKFNLIESVGQIETGPSRFKLSKGVGHGGTSRESVMTQLFASVISTLYFAGDKS